MRQQKAKFPPTPDRCWEDPEGTKRVWALMARSERDNNGYDIGGGYRHLRFDLVSVADVYDDDKRRIRNNIDGATYNLEVYSQGNRLDPDRLYAYGAQYASVHHADLDKLGTMYRFLSALQKKLDREKREHGDAPDFAHYMVRIARVLGCHYIIEKRERGEDWSYDRGDYRYTSLREGGRFNGQSCLWAVQRMVRDLWSETDRKDAAIHEERQAAERKARAEREAEASEASEA